jgi:hypothetical protein
LGWLGFDHFVSKNVNERAKIPSKSRINEKRPAHLIGVNDDFIFTNILIIMTSENGFLVFDHNRVGR